MRLFTFFLISLSSLFAFAEVQLFDYQALIDLDVRAKQVLAETTGIENQDEAMKAYFNSTEIQNKPEFREIRESIRSYLRSTDIKLNLFKLEYGYTPDDTAAVNRHYQSLRAQYTSNIHISKILTHLLIADFYTALTLSRETCQDSFSRRLNDHDFILVQLSPIFGMMERGGFGGPTNNWKSYAKEASTALFILSVTATVAEGNLDNNCFAVKVIMTDLAIGLRSIDAYAFPLAALSNQIFRAKKERNCWQ